MAEAMAAVAMEAQAQPQLAREPASRQVVVTATVQAMARCCSPLSVTWAPEPFRAW
jgi:hypothetical protein